MSSTPRPSASSMTGSHPSGRFWDQRLDSLATELARGKRERRLGTAAEVTVKETIR